MYVYIYIYITISLSLYIYIYTYICIHTNNTFEEHVQTAVRCRFVTGRHLHNLLGWAGMSIPAACGKAVAVAKVVPSEW